MNKPIAQRAKFKDQRRPNPFDGTLVWLKSGPPSGHYRCGSKTVTAFEVHEPRSFDPDLVCSNCVEMLPEFLMEDGSVIIANVA